jgi:membrane associated rhomboid family serine protease
MGMEPDMKEFLVRIVQTISMGLLWMLLNMTFGIYFGFGFFDDRPSTANYIYYVGFIISLVLLILYFRKKWKGKM